MHTGRHLFLLVPSWVSSWLLLRARREVVSARHPKRQPPVSRGWLLSGRAWASMRAVVLEVMRQVRREGGQEGGRDVRRGEGGQVGACAHTARGAARWTLRITGHTHDAGSTTQHPHVGRGLRRRVGVGRRGRPCAQQRQKPLVWPPSMRSGHVTCCACRLTFVRIVTAIVVAIAHV